MENLIDQFDTSLQSISGGQKIQDEFSTSYLYKYRQDSGLKQEERRIEHLSRQKNQRSKNVDKSRGIFDLIDEAKNNSKSYRPIYIPGFGRNHNKYSNLLMFSEWLVEKPHDFSTNWCVSPCPKGKRVTVVHSKDSTTCYDKVGHFLFSFRSAFSQIQEHKYACTILDCIWSKGNDTFYVLDLMVWSNYPIVDSPTDFRQYWIQSKFEEIPKLKKPSKKATHKFYLLPKINCTQDDLNRTMSTLQLLTDNGPDLDGWLFYHKQALYEPGTTPLVGWLKPYMVNEILGDDITVHKKYAADKPHNYTNQENFIKKFNEKSNRKSRTSQGGNETHATNVSISVEMKDLNAVDNSSKIDLVSNAMDSDNQESSITPETSQGGSKTDDTNVSNSVEMEEMNEINSVDNLSKIDSVSNVMDSDNQESSSLPETSQSGSKTHATDESISVEMKDLNADDNSFKTVLVSDVIDSDNKESCGSKTSQGENKIVSINVEMEDLNTVDNLSKIDLISNVLDSDNRESSRSLENALPAEVCEVRNEEINKETDHKNADTNLDVEKCE